METASTARSREAIVDDLIGTVIISCQAGPESPLNEPRMLAALAASAELGGASGFRVDTPENIRAVREVSAKPILGINKVYRGGSDVFITPTLADALAIVEAGADLVALDGTVRPRPGGETFADIVAALHDRGVPVMADIATPEDAEAAAAAGADIVATTLAGYTAETEWLSKDEPAWELLAAIRDLPVPVFVEGRIWTREHAVLALDRGASSVIIGSAVTVPQFITQRFVAAVESRTAGVAR
jgi:N-acylglucosamine-6-phosphate 2-epimerase